ncbi:GumC family protein [Maribacter aestuarii]|uniref:GumC family protein n=1 Tax=Maribacter aestuarii TaxID=1130723 RepID=UPI0025A4E969|nr:tyrosine-protein kinase family protein [Maribacter aestuarii]
MKDAPFTLDISDDGDSFNLKETLSKYLRYWPWFLVSLLLCIILGIIYLRYAPNTYESTAKIKIIDETKEMNVTTDPLSLLNGSGQINMDNEIEILTSYRLLSEVSDTLRLDVSYYEKGNIKTTQIWNPPFRVTKDVSEDSLVEPKTFGVRLAIDHIAVTDEQDRSWKVNFFELDTTLSQLPFQISLAPTTDINEHLEIDYEIVLKSKQQAVEDLEEDLQLQPTSKNSEIVALALKGESYKRSEAILNTLITVYNQDGILDRQQVSKRTLDFIDERFLYLSTELDSIEGGKESFKRTNNLSYIEADAGISLERKSETENQVADLETQLSLSDLLKETVVNQSAYSLLPVDIGLDNSSLSTLVSNYNEMALEREKLGMTIGDGHPSMVALSEQLERAKVNILKTVNVYQRQLRTSLGRLNSERSKASSAFAGLPEKEKMLRSIERQQSIKENLFLLLLQKREEAAINFAVTAPSVKVVDYAETSNKPVAPKKLVVLGIAGLLGLFLPFAVIFAKNTLDTQINTKADLEKLLPTIPIIAEIPHLKNHKVFVDINDRSLMAESFRILASNLKYLLPKNKSDGKVIYVSSAMEGEGKSLLAYNLSVALASLNKKVLLVGADLRNPKLHDFFGMGKSTKGLSDFLSEPNRSTKEFIYPGLEKATNHKVCLSGPVPPNAPLLLSSEGFEVFITDVKKSYEYIIVDTAPMMLVTDTSLISEYADIMLLIARAGLSERATLENLGNSKLSDNFKNLALILNDSKLSIKASYSYGAV